MRKKPKKKQERIAFQCAADEKTAFDEACGKVGISMSVVLRRAIQRVAVGETHITDLLGANRR